jgi:hypothetical protein
MKEKILKIGAVEIGVWENEEGKIIPKNKELLLQCFLFEIKEVLKQKMLKNPALHFKENLFALDKIQEDVFQFKNADHFLEVLSQTESQQLFANSDEDKLETRLEVPRKLDRPQKLAVIVPFFNVHTNPMLIENYENFRREISEDVFVVEAAFCSTPYQIEESKDFLRIRGDELNFMWQKERLLNLALKKLPPEYTDVAWIDADVLFDNKNWVRDLKDGLNKYCFLQLFETAQWLDKVGHPEVVFNTIVKQCENLFADAGEAQANGYHPGFAWAARREILDKTGWFDQHICGNGDSFIYYAISGHLFSPNYLQMKNRLIGFNYCFLKFRDKIKKANAASSLSFIPGNVRHMYHGDFKDRDYAGRQKHMMDVEFDPIEDLVLDNNGLYRWAQNEKTVKLSQNILEYFKQRNKDE